MEKLTNVKALEMVLDMELSNELREKLEKMKATFEKKNSYGGNGKPTKTQLMNEEIKVKILDFLSTVDKATISEIQKVLFSDYPEIKNQKVSAIVTLLKKDNKVVRFEEKRKAYFSIVKQD